MKRAFVFVGSSADAIEVFAVREGRCERIQSIASMRPAALALAPNGRVLYAVNEVAEYRGLPRGTVEAFAIHQDGTIAQLNRQELSLSATMPRHIAVSRDGKSLVVAAHGGGVYNTLAIEEDGSLGRTSGILKETGDRDGRQAQPRAAAFDQAGRIVSIDQGTARLRVLTDDNGLTAHANSTLEQGNGPRHLTFAPGGKTLYVAHGDSLQCYEYDHNAGYISKMRQHLPGTGVVDGAEVIAAHPSGRYLFACDAGGGIAGWRVDDSTTELRANGRYAEEMGRLQALTLSDDGKYMIALNAERGLVWRAAIDVVTGMIGDARSMARVDSPISLQVIYS